MPKSIPLSYCVVLGVLIFASGYFLRPMFEQSDERICAQIFGDGNVNDEDASLFKKLGLKATDKTGAAMFCKMKLKL